MPSALLEAIRSAILEANSLSGGSPPWSLEGVGLVAGLTVESFRLGNDLVLLFAQDDTAYAVTYETWLPLEGAAIHGDRDEADRFLARARRRPGDPRLREIESLGGIVGQGLREGLAYLRTLIPTPKGGSRSALAMVVAAESERLEAVTSRPGGTATVAADAPSLVLAASLREGTSRARSALENTLREQLRHIPRPKDGVSDPSRAIISVAGAADRRELLTEVRRCYAPSIAKGSSETAPTSTAEPSVEGASSAGRQPVVTIEIPTKSPTLLIGWPIPPANHEDHVALQAIAHLLADGEESRLGRALLPGTARAIEASAIRTTGPGVFQIFLALRSSQTSTEAVSLIEGEIRAIARGETTGIEIETAQESLRGRILRELDRLEDRAGALARARIFDGRLDANERRLSSVSGLVETRVRSAAARYLTRSTRALVIGRPGGADTIDAPAPPSAPGDRTPTTPTSIDDPAPQRKKADPAGQGSRVPRLPKKRKPEGRGP